MSGPQLDIDKAAAARKALDRLLDATIRPGSTVTEVKIWDIQKVVWLVAQLDLILGAAVTPTEPGWKCASCGWATTGHAAMQAALWPEGSDGRVIALVCPNCHDEGNFVDYAPVTPTPQETSEQPVCIGGCVLHHGPACPLDVERCQEHITGLYGAEALCAQPKAERHPHNSTAGIWHGVVPVTSTPEAAKGHVRPTPQADRRAAELRRTGIPDAMDGPYDPPFRAATEQSCVCYCHRWPSRTSYCWNMGCSCGQIGGPPAESLDLKPAPKTVAGLLREVAAADPEGHNARLGRAYGVGPTPEAATEARPEFFHRRPTRGPETVRAPVAPPTPEATDGNISPELLRAGSLPTLTSGGDNDGDIPGRQRAEGHGEHAHGNGEQREGSPVPRVRAEVGADVLQRRDHVRDGLPLVRAREHDDARVAPSGLQRATEQQQ